MTPQQTPPTYNGNEGHPLTDLEQYNIDLKHNTDRLNYQSKILKYGIATVALIGGGFLLLFVFILWQIMRWDLFTRWIEALS